MFVLPATLGLFGLSLALDWLLLKLRWRKAKLLSHRNRA